MSPGFARSTVFWSLSIFLSLAGSSSLRAAYTVDAKLTGLTSGSPGISIKLFNSSQNVLAGEQYYTKTGGDPNSWFDPTFKTFCVELTQNVTIGHTYTFEKVKLDEVPRPGAGLPSNQGMGTVKANLIRELWGKYYSSVTNASTAAAFQLAIWEIVYDGEGTLSLTNGNFLVNNSQSIRTTAQGWLSSLDGTGLFENRLVGLTSPGKQDQITMWNGPPDFIEAVPAPSSWILASIGLCCLAGGSMLRRRVGLVVA